MPIERKLAAIMFTDIAGYTALSAKDSTKASEVLKTQRDTLKPIVEKHGGSWMKEMGDGLLLTFDSATSAVECSIAIQVATKDIEDLNLRIGIHEGEVIKQDGDVIGDDVNVASRIEPFSAVGGVAISDKIYRAISSNKDFETKYIGKPKLKGVAQKVEVYCITSHGLPETDISKVSAKLEEESKFNIFALTGGILTAIGVAFWIAIGIFDVSFGGKMEVPSVGILMMENLGKEDEEFWSSGMTADLITKVAGAGLIRVAPLDDILKLDKDLSIEEKAEKLRVKYILTHSFLIKNDGFDLWCKLENIETGIALFSNKISEPMDMTTQMVGKLANDIVTSLKVETKQDMMEAPTNNAEAYAYYLRAKSLYQKHDPNPNSYEIVRSLLSKAIELDNNLFEAKLLLGKTYLYVWGGGGGVTKEFWQSADYNKAIEIFQAAIIRAEDSLNNKWKGQFLNILGSIYTHQKDYDKGLEYINSALSIAKTINDKSIIATSLSLIGRVNSKQNDYDTAIEYYQKALNLREKLGDKTTIANSLRAIGIIYEKGLYDFDKAEKYFNRSRQLYKELGDERMISTLNYLLSRLNDYAGNYDTAIEYLIKSYKIYLNLGESIRCSMILSNIGEIYLYKGDYDQAVEYYKRSFDTVEQSKKIGYKKRMGVSFWGIGNVYLYKGDLDTALDYIERSLKIFEEIDFKHGIGASLNNIGLVYRKKGENDKAVEYLEKSLTIKKEIGVLADDLIWSTTYLYLTYKHLGKEIDVKEIHRLIKEVENIEFELNLRLYELFEDISYLESAYNQVQEKADAMDEELGKKYLSYPIPKAIVEEWEKVK